MEVPGSSPGMPIMKPRRITLVGGPFDGGLIEADFEPPPEIVFRDVSVEPPLETVYRNTSEFRR